MVSRCGTGVFCWSFGKGPPSLRKAVSAECKGIRLGISRLGSQCWHCAVYLNWFMLKDGGKKWCQPAPLSLERGLCACCSQGNTSRRVNNFLLCIPSVSQIAVFSLSISRLLACLEQHSALWVISHPSLVTFETPNFKVML